MKQASGFTLIELMIVIGIIVCLSAMAVPSLMKMVAKAKRSEAYIYLRSLAQLEQLYFAEHGCYTKNLVAAGWKPGVCNYTYGFSDGKKEEGYFIGQLKTPSSSLTGSSLSPNGFTIVAAGHIYGEKADVLSIDQNNVIKVLSDALA